MSFEDMPKRLEQIHYPKNAVSIVVFNDKDEILMSRSKRYTTMLSCRFCMRCSFVIAVEV